MQENTKIWGKLVSLMVVYSMVMFVFMGCQAKVDVKPTDGATGDEVIVIGDGETIEGKLVIDEILGNGSSSDRIKDGIIIKGSGFGDSPAVEFLDRISKALKYSLTVTSVNAEEINANLPEDLEEGEYTIKVKNASLSDERDITILKGEKGDPGTGAAYSLDAADGNPTAVVYVDNDGYVGIGTGDPKAKLHVALDDGTMPPIDEDIDDDEVALILSNNSDEDDGVILQMVGGTEGESGIIFGSSDEQIRGAVGYDHGDGEMFFFSSDDMVFIANEMVFAIDEGDDEDQVVVIDSSGHVGIGTEEPKAQLHILGDMDYDDDEGDSVVLEIENIGNGIAALGLQTDSRRWGLGVCGSGAGEMSGKFGICDVKEEMICPFVIDTEGNDDAGNIIVNDTIKSVDTKLFILSDSSIHMGIDYNDDETDRGFTIDAGPPGAGETLFVVQENGHVGIGTESPTATLHVDGFSRFDSNIHGGTNNMLSFISTLPGDKNKSEIRFTTSDGSGQMERMRISPDGNVGIGTTSPAEGYKLDVEGMIQATAFDVGDITFRDQKTQKILWRMFEDEDGLYLENMKTGQIYRLVLQEVRKADIKIEDLHRRLKALEEKLASFER